MKRRFFAVAAVIGLVLGITSTGYAASPGSGTVGPSSGSVQWTGQSFVAAATPSPSACSPATCDTFTLNVGVDSAYWNSHAGTATVSISWGTASNNFDLFVSSGGNQVGSSASGSGTSEQITISKPSGTYQVQVVPKSVVNSGYNGSASFSSTATSTGGGAGGGGGGTGSGGGGGTGAGGGTKGGGTKGGGTKGGGKKGGSGTGSGGGSTGGGGSPTCAGCSFNGETVSSEKLYFTYGYDQRSWWWPEQVDQDIPNTGQRIQLPNPQDPATLPVSVHQGQPDKISAIQFSLIDRGLQVGSSIVQFTLKMAEGNQAGDKQPEFNQEGKKIQACFMTDLWADSDSPNVTKDQNGKDVVPPYDKNKCVVGKQGGTATNHFYTFNLTTIAEPWGEDPATKNNGVMLLPVIPKDAGPQDQEWQVNLLLPVRHDDPTTPSNEEKDTHNRVVGTIAFTAPATPTTGGGTTTGGTTGTGGTTTSTGGAGGTFVGGSGGFPGGTSTTTTTTGGGDATGTTTTGPAPAPVANVPAVQLPGIVWALIPVGLIALWAVRQMVLDPVGGPRQDGVIAAIRRRNAATRGMPIEESDDVITQARAATRRARSLIRRGLRRR